MLMPPPPRPSASVRKASGGSRSTEGAQDHAVLQSVSQTYRAMRMDFYGSMVRHLVGNTTVKRSRSTSASAAGAAAGRGSPRKGAARRPAWPMPCGPR